MPSIPLSGFEHHIDPTILKRGLKYYKEGLVTEFEHLRSDVYSAVVTGSDSYEVSVTIRDGKLTDQVCSCPYDLGPVCKHVVAVLFTITSGEFTDKAAEMKSVKNRKKSMGIKTTEQKIKENISSIPAAELAQFVIDHSLENRNFREALSLRFSDDHMEQTVAYFRKAVNNIFNKAGKRRGFIEWNKVHIVGRESHAMMERVRLTGNAQTRFHAGVAFLEELTKALNFADDSDGDIGGNIDNAYSLLMEVASEKQLPDPLRRQLWDYAMKTYQKKLFDGWDWHFGMLELAAKLIRSKEEADILMKILKSVRGDDSDSFQYEVHQARILQFYILERHGSAREAEMFAQENISNPKIRKKVINDFISQKRYDEAIRLAREGINYDQQKRPGLVTDWMESLLSIAVLQNNREHIREYASWFILEGKRVNEYLGLVKKIIYITEWNAYVDDLLQMLSRKKGWNEQTIREILIFDQRWDDLIATFSDDLWLNTLESYISELQKHRPAQLAKLYSRAILFELTRITGRNKYKWICRHIRRMKKLGQPEITQTLVQNIRTKYANRPSLMEELDQVW